MLTLTISSLKRRSMMQNRHAARKFLGYRPGVYVIGEKIVYVENSDGNTNVRFYQAETHKRFFALLEANCIRVNRFRADHTRN